MAITQESLPYPTSRLDGKDVVSSLDLDKYLVVITDAGVRRIEKGNVGFSRLYVQSTAPAGDRTTSDLWIDTDNGNSLKAWDGSSWVARNFGATNIQLADIQNVTGDRVLGRLNNDGTIQQLTAAQVRALLNVTDGANNYTHPDHTGQVTSDGDGTTTLEPNTVSNAQLNTVPGNSVKARSTTGTGNTGDIELAANRTLGRRSTGNLAAQPVSDAAWDFLGETGLLEYLFNNHPASGIVDESSVEDRAITARKMAWAYRAVSGADSFGVEDYTLDCDGTFTVDLPDADTFPARICVVKNSGSGTITVAAAGDDEIEGSATETVATGDSLTVQSTGNGWIII